MASARSAALIYSIALSTTIIAFLVPWAVVTIYQTPKSCVLPATEQKRLEPTFHLLPRGEGYATAAPALKSQARSAAGGSSMEQSFARIKVRTGQVAEAAIKLAAPRE